MIYLPLTYSKKNDEFWKISGIKFEKLHCESQAIFIILILTQTSSILMSKWDKRKMTSYPVHMPGSKLGFAH